MMQQSLLAAVRAVVREELSQVEFRQTTNEPTSGDVDAAAAALLDGMF